MCPGEGASVSPCISCAFSSTFFFCLFCPILLFVCLFVLSYIVVQMSVCFPMRSKKSIDSDGRKGGKILEDLGEKKQWLTQTRNENREMMLTYLKFQCQQVKGNCK